MSIIEQAARRLEELKRAGIVLPPGVTASSNGAPAGQAARARPSVISAVMAQPNQAAPAARTAPPLAPANTLGAAAARAAMAIEAAGVAPQAVQATPAPALHLASRGTHSSVLERHGGTSAAQVAANAAPGQVSAARVILDNTPVPAAQQRRSREVTLDLEQLNSSGYLVPGQNRTALAEQMRIIKRPLLANARGEGAEPVERANLIQVVSALPGEGKTFVAMNLAMSIAMEVDHSVLLVDADVLRPSVLDRYGLDSAPGLLDVLSDRHIDLADVLLRTNVPKLSLLPAGTASLKSTELLASDAMERLLDELAAKYADRIIVFDAPPLIPTTESRVLASRVGQVVMVVEADSTTRAQAAQAYAALEQCPVVLSVLNKSHQRSSEAYGYYYAA
jgi:receptor protein-tyrosine kinase